MSKPEIPESVRSRLIENVIQQGLPIGKSAVGTCILLDGEVVGRVTAVCMDEVFVDIGAKYRDAVAKAMADEPWRLDYAAATITECP